MFIIKEYTYICSVEYAYSLIDIQAKVAERMKDLCTVKDGFFHTIENVVVVSAKASTKGTILCETRCLVKFLLPMTGEMVTATVEKCVEGKGIYCRYERINILVPFRSFERSYVFRDDTFRARAGSRHILEGDVIVILIEKTRYQTGQYRVLASIK